MFALFCQKVAQESLRGSQNTPKGAKKAERVPQDPKRAQNDLQKTYYFDPGGSGTSFFPKKDPKMTSKMYSKMDSGFQGYPLVLRT